MKYFRFTLRDLCWFVLVFAMACAWWMQQGRIAEARRDKVLAEDARKNAERLSAYYQKIIDAYRRDTPFHDVTRGDGSVYVTDEDLSQGPWTPGNSR